MKSVLNSDSGNNVILRSRQLNFSNKVATISDSRVTEDTLILIYYSEATQAAAQAAGITAETNAGNITFTAANTPSSAIVCDIVLLSANMVNFSASANQIDYSNSTSGLSSTTVQGAIDEVNSSSSTTKSTSYGTLYITKYGKIVELNGTFQNIPTSAWTTLTTGLPLPKSGTGHQFINVSADGGGQVSVNLASNGSLQYYGRGSISAFILEATYISE